MRSRDERSRLRLVAYGLLSLLVALAAIPGYLMLDPSWRPVAIRLACAALVIAGCMRIVAGVRRSLEDEPPSALDLPPRPSPRRELNERFVRLRDDLVFSTLSRRYFDTQLWPRLCKLAGGELAAPPPGERRRGRRRGPTMATLDRLIAEIERRRIS
jgi:hypothetical protein